MALIKKMRKDQREMAFYDIISAADYIVLAHLLVAADYDTEMFDAIVVYTTYQSAFHAFLMSLGSIEDRAERLQWVVLNYFRHFSAEFPGHEFDIIEQRRSSNIISLARQVVDVFMSVLPSIPTQFASVLAAATSLLQCTSLLHVFFEYVVIPSLAPSHEAVFELIRCLYLSESYHQVSKSDFLSHDELQAFIDHGGSVLRNFESVVNQTNHTIKPDRAVVVSSLQHILSALSLKILLLWPAICRIPSVMAPLAVVFQNALEKMEVKTIPALPFVKASSSGVVVIVSEDRSDISNRRLNEVSFVGLCEAIAAVNNSTLRISHNCFEDAGAALVSILTVVAGNKKIHELILQDNSFPIDTLPQIVPLLAPNFTLEKLTITEHGKDMLKLNRPVGEAVKVILKNNILLNHPEKVDKKKTSVDFSDRGLERLPRALWNLTFIKELILDCNEILEIPTEFQYLSHLTVFSARRNHILYIPQFVSYVTTLEMIFLDYNEIEDFPAFLVETLPKLRVLGLSNNSIGKIDALPTKYPDVLREITLVNNPVYNMLVENFQVDRPAELLECMMKNKEAMSQTLLVNVILLADDGVVPAIPPALLRMLMCLDASPKDAQEAGEAHRYNLVRTLLPNAASIVTFSNLMDMSPFTPAFRQLAIATNPVYCLFFDAEDSQCVNRRLSLLVSLLVQIQSTCTFILIATYRNINAGIEEFLHKLREKMLLYCKRVWTVGFCLTAKVVKSTCRQIHDYIRSSATRGIVTRTQNEMLQRVNMMKLPIPCRLATVSPDKLVGNIMLDRTTVSDALQALHNAHILVFDEETMLICANRDFWICNLVAMQQGVRGGAPHRECTRMAIFFDGLSCHHEHHRAAILLHKYGVVITFGDTVLIPAWATAPFPISAHAHFPKTLRARHLPIHDAETGPLGAVTSYTAASFTPANLYFIQMAFCLPMPAAFYGLCHLFSAMFQLDFWGQRCFIFTSPPPFQTGQPFCILVTTNESFTEMGVTISVSSIGLSLLSVFFCVYEVIKTHREVLVAVEVPCNHCLSLQRPATARYIPVSLLLDAVTRSLPDVYCNGETHQLYPGIDDVDRWVPVSVASMFPYLHHNTLVQHTDLEDVHKLDEGGYGVVLSAKWQGMRVAVKQMLQEECVVGDHLRDANTCASISTDCLSMFFTEIGLLFTKPHPFIVTIYAVIHRPLASVLEYAPHGNLHAFLKSCADPLPEAFMLRSCIQIARAVAFMHSCNPPILHRDLKSPNVLIFSADPDSSLVKIADFGSACLAPLPVNGRVVFNPRWLAPEILRGGYYWLPSDVFSLGIILWELLTRQSPYDEFEEAIEVVLEEMIVYGARPTIPRGCHRELVGVMQACWANHPNSRPTMGRLCARLTEMASRAGVGSVCNGGANAANGAGPG